MPAQIFYGQAFNRRNMARRRQQLGDGVTLATPDGVAANFRRADAKFVFMPPNYEVAGMIEDDFNSEFVPYIKNTTGSSILAGTLLVGTTSLTASGSATGPNIAAGSAVVAVIPTVTGTIEAGSMCQFTDSVAPNPVQYAICTNVSGTSYTFDEIPYDMTTPAIAVIPAMIPALATNASGGHASWIATQTIANNAYAFVYGAARVGTLNTSGYSAVGSNVYLGTGGASTPTAPTTSTTTAQLVGKVIVKSSTVGIIQYYPYRRENTKIASSGLQPGAGVPAGVAAGDLLIDQGSGNAPTFNAMSGDATITSTGALTVANLAITNAKIAASTIDLTAKVTGILPSANGGTANGFTTFTGPTTSAKTFTLPNATCSLLTTNAAVTVAQGGTGLATLTAHSVQLGNGTSSPTQLAVPASGTLLTGVASSDPAFSATPTLGVAGTTQGSLTLAGSSSGTCIVTTAAAAGTSTRFQLPPSNGTNTYVLQTDGSGNTSWAVSAVTSTKGRLTAQTGATAGLVQLTVGGSDTTYIVTGNIRVTASSSHSFFLAVAFTDETNTGQGIKIPLVQNAVTNGPLQLVTNTLGVGYYAGMTLCVRCKAGTNIDIDASGTFGSVTYDVEGVITPA